MCRLSVEKTQDYLKGNSLKSSKPKPTKRRRRANCKMNWRKVSRIFCLLVYSIKQRRLVKSYKHLKSATGRTNTEDTGSAREPHFVSEPLPPRLASTPSYVKYHSSYERPEFLVQQLLSSAEVIHGKSLQPSSFVFGALSYHSKDLAHCYRLKGRIGGEKFRVHCW